MAVVSKSSSEPHKTIISNSYGDKMIIYHGFHEGFPCFYVIAEKCPTISKIFYNYEDASEYACNIVDQD